jgi:hypothetical protein
MSDNDTSQDEGHGLLAKLKNVLFEPETPPPQGAASAVAPPGAAPAAPAARPVAAANPMAERMMAVVMDRTTAYTALMEAITPLEGYIADEASRYKAAFAIVGKTRSLEQIVQSIDMQHLPALDAETQRFQAQAQAQKDQQVDARNREMDALRTTIANAEQEQKRLETRLAQVQQEAATARAKMGKIDQEIAQKQQEIAQVNQQFETALAQVRERLAQAKAKVVKYLGN